MLARYREAEQRQLADLEKARVDKLGEDVRQCEATLHEYLLIREQCLQLKKELDETHNSQTLLIEKLIQCCKEVYIIFSLSSDTDFANVVPLPAERRTNTKTLFIPSRRT